MLRYFGTYCRMIDVYWKIYCQRTIREPRLSVQPLFPFFFVDNFFNMFNEILKTQTNEKQIRYNKLLFFFSKQHILLRNYTACAFIAKWISVGNSRKTWPIRVDLCDSFSRRSRCTPSEKKRKKKKSHRGTAPLIASPTVPDWDTSTN